MSQALVHAHELAALAQQHHLDLWLAVATGVEGWATAVMGKTKGLQQTADAISMARMAMSATEPTFCSMHVGALHALGRYQDCATQAEEALHICEKHMDHYFAAELWCLRGEALGHLPGKQSQALDCLRQALELATSQGARTLELRAARSLLQRSTQASQRTELETRITHILNTCPELSTTPINALRA